MYYWSGMYFVLGIVTKVISNSQALKGEVKRDNSKI